ncbi:MAG: phosphopyruvate hydratase [Mycoplasmoidaceae bacterium]|nr:MAG: phosphopyruvate hydratase [Mycoplasmoidaceae bacterium]
MGKGTIKNIFAYEVLDSRGYPTVACRVTTSEGIVAVAMVPSGASTGEREALELRDGDKNRYMGKGVLKAVKNVNTLIAKALVGKFSVLDQKKIDECMIKLDGTPTKSKFGANAILSVSMAVCKAGAMVSKKPLYEYIKQSFSKAKDYTMPVPMLNVINGGAHADNTIDFQEFMFMPVGAKSIHEACRVASECFHSLAKLLKNSKFNTSKGDEGGFAPLLKDAEQALTLMVQAVTAAGYKPGIKGDVAFAMDTACSELYDSKTKMYTFEKAVKAGLRTKQNGTITSDAMIKYLESITKKFPIISIEDGLSENDREGWAKWMKADGAKLQIVGDDLYCTNPAIVKQGITGKWSNSVLIKLNQIGTVSETVQTILDANKAGWTAVVSHRSGETEDTFIADFVVGMGTGQIKTGSMSRSERIAKYNRLMEIENELGSKAKYKKLAVFSNIKI